LQLLDSPQIRKPWTSAARDSTAKIYAAYSEHPIHRLSDIEHNGYSGMYATHGTIHNFNIWYAAPSDEQQNLFLLTSVAASQRSAANLNGLFQAAGATPGTYNIYVEFVGMPMIMNQMSPPVPYNYE